MGKTYKDKANHLFHHTRPTDTVSAVKSKHKYQKTDIDEVYKTKSIKVCKVRQKLDILETAYGSACNRHGNNRKSIAAEKIKSRRIQRRQLNKDTTHDIE